MPDNKVQITIEAINNTKGALDDLKAQLTSTGEAATKTTEQNKSALSGLQSDWVAFAGAAVAAWMSIKEAMEYVHLGAMADQAGEAFRTVASSAGESADGILEAMKKASNGTVAESELMQKALKGMTQGLSGEDVIKLTEVARVAARTMGTDVSTAFDLITDAVANKMPRSLVQAGLLTKEQMKIINAAVASGNESIDLMGIVVASANLKLAQMGGVSENTAESLQKIWVWIKELTESIGKGMIIGLQSAGNLFKYLEIAALGAVDGLAKFGEAFYKAVAFLADKAGLDNVAAKAREAAGTYATESSKIEQKMKGLGAEIDATNKKISGSSQKASQDAIDEAQKRQQAEIDKQLAIARTASVLESALKAMQASHKAELALENKQIDDYVVRAKAAGVSEVEIIVNSTNQKQNLLDKWYKYQLQEFQKEAEAQQAKNGKTFDADAFLNGKKTALLAEYNTKKKELELTASKETIAANKQNIEAAAAMYKAIDQFSDQSVQAELANLEVKAKELLNKGQNEIDVRKWVAAETLKIIQAAAQIQLDQMKFLADQEDKQLTNNLDMTKTVNAQLSDSNKYLYDQKLISATDFYNKEAELLQSNTDAEINTLNLRFENFRTMKFNEWTLVAAGSIQEQKIRDEIAAAETKLNADITKVRTESSYKNVQFNRQSKDEILKIWENAVTGQEGYEQALFNYKNNLAAKERDRIAKDTGDWALANKVYADKVRDNYIEMAKYSDDWRVGVTAGLLEIQKNHETWGRAMSDLTKSTFCEMEKGASSMFFDVVTGDISKLGSDFDNLWKSILKSFIDMLVKMAAEWAATKALLALGVNIPTTTGAVGAGLGSILATGGLTATDLGLAGAGTAVARGGGLLASLASLFGGSGLTSTELGLAGASAPALGAAAVSGETALGGLGALGLGSLTSLAFGALPIGGIVAGMMGMFGKGATPQQVVSGNLQDLTSYGQGNRGQDWNVSSPLYNPKGADLSGGFQAELDPEKLSAIIDKTVEAGKEFGKTRTEIMAMVSQALGPANTELTKTAERISNVGSALKDVDFPGNTALTKDYKESISLLRRTLIDSATPVADLTAAIDRSGVSSTTTEGKVRILSDTLGLNADQAKYLSTMFQNSAFVASHTSEVIDNLSKTLSVDSESAKNLAQSLGLISPISEEATAKVSKLTTILEQNTTGAMSTRDAADFLTKAFGLTAEKADALSAAFAQNHLASLSTAEALQVLAGALDLNAGQAAALAGVFTGTAITADNIASVIDRLAKILDVSQENAFHLAEQLGLIPKDLSTDYVFNIIVKGSIPKVGSDGGVNIPSNVGSETGLNPTPTPGDPYPGGNVWLGTFHDGGKILQAHTGYKLSYNLGLAYDEVPIIAKMGERVLSPGGNDVFEKLLSRIGDVMGQHPPVVSSQPPATLQINSPLIHIEGNLVADRQTFDDFSEKIYNRIKKLQAWGH